MWGGSDLSLERGVLRIRPPVASVRLAELLSRVGRRRRDLETRRHLPRGVDGSLLRAKEEECGAEEPTCADRTAVVCTCAAVVGSQVAQEAESGMGGRPRRVLIPSPWSVSNFLDISTCVLRKMPEPVEKPLYAPSEHPSRTQKPLYCSVLALMSKRLDAVLDSLPVP